MRGEKTIENVTTVGKGATGRLIVGQRRKNKEDDFNNLFLVDTFTG